MARSKRVALVYGAPAGLGGLGLQIASAIQGLAVAGVELHAFGPGRLDGWPFRDTPPELHWHQAPAGVSRWRARFTWLRWWTGELVLKDNRACGRWAARLIERLAPDCCYVFTQVGLETLQWARRQGVPTILESPNGHIGNFRRVNEEAARAFGVRFRGHPNAAMVERVEREYRLADRIRVSSRWSEKSLRAYGSIESEIGVFEQPVDLERYRLLEGPVSTLGPLRICFVGSLDLRKGFVHLLRAAKLVGVQNLIMEIVGATGDRFCRKLFSSESRGLSISCAPGDPIPAYHRAELFVLPTLEDGSPFAVAEAMASGLPVIVTDCCGAAEWVRPGESGWVVRGADAEGLAAALEEAIKHRSALRAMGRIARQDTERRAGPHCLAPLREWVFGGHLSAVASHG